MGTLRAAHAEVSVPPAAPTATGSSVSAAQLSAMDHYQRGVQFYDAGAEQQALAEFSRAYALSSNYQLLFNVAQLQFRLGRFVSARESLERYLRDGGSRIPRVRAEQVAAQLIELKQRAGNEAPAQVPEATPAPLALSSRTQPVVIVGWSATGLLGLGALGAGLATLLASHDYDQLRARPALGSAAGTRARLDEQRARVRHWALATDVLAGAALAGAGLTLYVMLNAVEPSASTGVAVRLGPGELSAVGSF
jgi:hypothetical protein